jgi:predicted nucleic acid-binding protein
VGLIIDTSAVVAWERALAADARIALDAEEELLMPAAVWAEALVGVRLAGSAGRAAQRKARLEAIRGIIGIEPFTQVIAEHYADIYSGLSERGSLIPQNDIAVAVPARCLGFGVLVGPRDEAHFREVASLEVRVLPIR